MKVSIDISSEYKEPFAVIHTDKVTDEVTRASQLLASSGAPSPITAQLGEKTVILKPSDIYMIRVEEGETVIYGAKEKYFSRKRLYEVQEQAGSKFMQISKTTAVNLSYLDSVEAGFGCTLLLKLKNGSKDYVSRKFLPDFKRYLGI